MSSTLQLPCPSFLRGGFLFLSFSFIIESWISYKRSLQIINVRHRHCVFTIDASLRDFFLQDRSLLNCLFHSVSSVVLRLFSKMNKHKNFTPGFIMVLHTFGRDLKWNPHIHCLISEGGYSDDASFLLSFYYWKKELFLPQKNVGLMKFVGFVEFVNNCT